MAYDTHSAATKGNREWQDKLLLVVYKAEEIMYSKANSEVWLNFLFFFSSIDSWIFIRFVLCF
jgi:hypothetical protein